MITTYIGIGANLGAAADMVTHALAELARLPGVQLLQASPRYASAPVDAVGDDYVNAVAACATTLSAEALLASLQALELACGRERSYRNAPRTLDLDILLYGQQHIVSAHLVVPHPRLCQRAFVLRPLLDLAPDIVIPGQGPAQSFLAGVASQRIRLLERAH
ncbi:MULTISPECIES: 2-amino-4-hydroxy-6-hydroxymethyldihydropteridine diphosphokinase [unclassified Undibacterium]|uniref:2-amino-4-hydroxy-6- hydroxymethyldihydropteridine diphosphokinase n=1 Tax=unclassified Undibacterium TaxID=2630295 RepID=UPI002AC97402|nr:MULTISPECIES: 2-amino-4-hydroxy-6-hydroxymethyldihydropteridine diphosphokinase [unclassified Undibacterium]MEB0139919.1 2-amino-4-hydroxy-6-hydroxymethyldihydropteridine diphosphokinase [Undibacterium sp. CCC2.1]MEB0171812.1 2-amino-4-hydroxy-6-hydroxymethyldihydropteridine diphosphokinase [Undibacterium sp. CCC1.1]MEB0175628.1 2-amino-4-hydroxy-6-hydroxymethyldihydropteridine diphosphokinase [Undibacterium sp. CCC3.4]MEB0216210.1 2-amino-4-hydroxy-6-hydroxymethyldihydropteridine diphosphok